MNAAEKTIRELIDRYGSIALPDFMELALYHPADGYYEKERSIGKAGDFYTSVSVGPVFGALLAWWIGSQPDTGSASDPIALVETGAHDGTLAFDIMTQMEAEFSRPFHYHIIEPSAKRQERQNQRLAAWSGRVTWHKRLSDLPIVNGVIFSNELLDAFPCHRLVWHKETKRWMESMIGLKKDKFSWKLQETHISVEGISPSSLKELEPLLPDGYVIETSPLAARWWQEASAHLGKGIMMTFDYGFSGLEQFIPERTKGTLRGYSSHQTTDPLQDPGEQDMTYHVQFDALREAGEKSGLATVFFDTQEKFLMNFVLGNPGFGGYLNGNPGRLRQLMTLCSPSHLGRFRCLVQKRL
ncbi:MAG: hypothetical protein JWN25_654 [Verrucomicrobiales bacterium]|nr:hypothetical protein [Verrucomicrobiales bacterium]